MIPEAGAARGFYRPHSGFPDWQPSTDPQEILDEALVWASKSNRVAVLDRLLRAGANIEADPYRGTPLIWAAACNRTEAAAWLLDHGANVNQKATFGGLLMAKASRLCIWRPRTGTCRWCNCWWNVARIDPLKRISTNPQRRAERLTLAGTRYATTCTRLAGGDGGLQEVAVHAGDHFELDLLGADGFAFADVGAASEQLLGWPGRPCASARL